MPSRRPTAAATDTPPQEQPRLVDGLRVVKDEPELSPLTKAHGAAVYFRGRRVLTLEGGAQVHACADCPDVTGTRGDIVKHRVEEHGAAKGGARSKTADTTSTDNVMRMTLGEVLRLAGQIDEWERLFDQMTVDRDDALARAATAETELRRIKRALERAGFTPKVDEED